MPNYLTYKRLIGAQMRTFALLLIVSLFSLSANTLIASQNKRDSLSQKIRAIEKNLNDDGINKRYIDLLNKLAKEYRYVKGDSLFNISKKALRLSKNIEHTLGECEALYNIANYYSDYGKNQKAIAYYSNAQKLADSLGELEIKIGIINNLAYEYSYSGDYEKALKNYLKGLDLAIETDHKLMQSIINENIAGLFVAQKEFEEALNFYKKVKKINEEIGNDIYIAETLSNLASLYSEMGLYEKAMFTINKSIAIFEKGEIYDWLAFAYSVKGEVYLQQDKFKWALYWFDQSNLLHKNLEDDRSRIDLLNGIATAYLGLKEDSISNVYALEALTVSKKIKSLEGQRDCVETLYKIHRNQGESQKALEYLEKLQKLSDSLYRDENRRSLTLLKTKLNYEKDKQLLIAENEKELAKQRNFIIVSIIILIVLLATAIPLYFNQKKLRRLYRELKTNTENLRDREAELNAINKTKDKLFSIIGHDLRGPLGALQGLLKLIASGDAAEDDFSKFIPKLRSDVDHILFTLNNLLSWGYSQMNGTVSKPKMVNLNKLLSSNINLLSEMANNKSIKIIDQLPENCLLLADENQIDVVIRNLISNAIKFTPESGLITIEASEEDKHWKVKVRDTGIGMNDKTRKKLFSENSNITTYGTNNEKGTGLGLSLCKEMVEKNKGKIWVESKPKKGSIFYFTMPKVTKRYRKAS